MKLLGDASWHLGLVISLAFMLAACGGGSGEGDEQPPPVSTTPTAEDLANASNAQLKAVLREDTNELTITWVDTFPSEFGYRVEVRTGTGEWESEESLPASPGTGTELRWQRVIDGAGTYRVLALRANYSVPLAVGGGQTEVMVDPATPGTLSLQLDRVEPLHGTVQLSVQNAATAASVSYFVDLVSIGTSTSPPAFAVNWDTSAISEGDHLLIAQVDSGEGSIVELRRTVTVDDPDLTVSLSISHTATELMLSATATAETGIHSIEFFMNGDSLAVLTTPTPDNGWLLTLDRQELPRELVTFKVIATDNTMETTQDQEQVDIGDFAILTLDSPVDGAIVSGQLQVQGSFTDDQPGAVVTASLGDVVVLNSSASPFATNYSLAGVPGGKYTLTASVTEASGRKTSIERQVVVETTPFNYELVASGVKRLLAAELGTLLYETEGGTILLREPDGTETTLNVAAGLSDVGSWQLSGNHVVMTARGPQMGISHIYLYDELGNVTNVSEQTGSTSNSEPVLRGNLLAWKKSAHAYAIYNLDTEALLQPPSPAGATKIGLGDFGTTSGDEQLIFSAGYGNNWSDGESEIYRYRLASGTTEPITNTTGFETEPQTDNVRVAWRQELDMPPYLMIAAPLSDPSAAQTVTGAMMTFQLRDGLLVWIDDDGAHRALKVDDGSTTTTLSTHFSVNLYSVADGDVIFRELPDSFSADGKLYVWSAALGTRTLLDSFPRDVMHDDKIAFVQSGSGVYRVVLP